MAPPLQLPPNRFPDKGRPILTIRQRGGDVRQHLICQSDRDLRPDSRAAGLSGLDFFHYF